MSSDMTGLPDGRDTLRTMGWVELPYGCTGILRRKQVDDRNTVWSWLILVPWSDDAKPWIDGTEIFGPSLKDEDDQRQDVLAKMRSLVDDRYGDVVGNSAVDDLIREIRDEA